MFHNLSGIGKFQLNQYAYTFDDPLISLTMRGKRAKRGKRGINR